jgi:hypothetical protein
MPSIAPKLVFCGSLDPLALEAYSMSGEKGTEQVRQMSQNRIGWIHSPKNESGRSGRAKAEKAERAGWVWEG